MNALRLVMVTPRYWPHVGDTERLMAALAEEFARLGARPTVLTAAWSPQWPRQIVHRDVPVVRLPAAPQGGWSTFRYLRALARWLRRNRSASDAVYVANLRYEAYTAIGALAGHPVPIVLRPAAGDAAWQAGLRRGRRIRRRCQQADAVVLSTPTLAAELCAAGYAPDRLHVIPPGAAAGISRSPEARFQARKSLAHVNHDLVAPDFVPVAVSVGRLDAHSDWFDLVQAWKPVVDRWPNARLWLIGDGPLRQALYEKIVDGGLQRNILLPGSFDDLSDLLQAADLYVAPRRDITDSSALLEALAAGLPTIATDTPGNRDIMEDNLHGLLVPPGDTAAWTGAITRILEAPRLANRLSASAQQLAAVRYSLAAAATAHLELIERLAATKRQDLA